MISPPRYIPHGIRLSLLLGLTHCPSPASGMCAAIRSSTLIRLSTPWDSGSRSSSRMQALLLGRERSSRMLPDCWCRPRYAPVDALHERLVPSVKTSLGARRGILPPPPPRLLRLLASREESTSGESDWERLSGRRIKEESGEESRWRRSRWRWSGRRWLWLCERLRPLCSLCVLPLIRWRRWLEGKEWDNSRERRLGFTSSLSNGRCCEEAAVVVDRERRSSFPLSCAMARCLVRRSSWGDGKGESRGLMGESGADAGSRDTGSSANCCCCCCCCAALAFRACGCAVAMVPSCHAAPLCSFSLPPSPGC